MAKIKICGIRRTEDIDYVNELKPDYIGFILSSGYRRSVNFDTVKRLKEKLDKNIPVVGVFVDDEIETINSFLENELIDYVQLHGNETPEYCKSINGKVIKVFKPENFDSVQDYDNVVEYYLFDSGAGTGKTFDWSIIPSTSKQFFIAGGINEDNITEAITKLNAFAVDLSSAVETDGVKDYNKMKKIMEIVRYE